MHLSVRNLYSYVPQVTDGSSLENLQIVVENDNSNIEDKGESVVELANSLRTGASVEFDGVLALHGGRPCKPGEMQKFELLATSCLPLGQCDEDYPIQAKYQTF